MLKELFANVPIAKQFTLHELQETLTRDFIALIREKTSFDLTKNLSSYTSIEIEQIISTSKTAYKKILASVVVEPDAKIFIANLLLSRLFELWKNSITPELFFIKIRKAFSPTQIVATLIIFLNNFDNFDWLTKFFSKNPQLFPNQNKKFHTIALYYSRIYSGGIAKILSLMIPIYISMGYRVVLFTEEYKPELEYPLPPPQRILSALS